MNKTAWLFQGSDSKAKLNRSFLGFFDLIPSLTFAISLKVRYVSNHPSWLAISSLELFCYYCYNTWPQTRWFITTPIYCPTDRYSKSLTELPWVFCSRSHKAEIKIHAGLALFGDSGWRISVQTHSRCRLNSVAHGFRTEVIILLLVDSWESLVASRGSPHLWPSIFKRQRLSLWVECFSFFKSFWLSPLLPGRENSVFQGLVWLD